MVKLFTCGPSLVQNPVQATVFPVQAAGAKLGLGHSALWPARWRGSRRGSRDSAGTHQPLLQTGNTFILLIGLC